MKQPTALLSLCLQLLRQATLPHTNGYWCEQVLVLLFLTSRSLNFDHVSILPNIKYILIQFDSFHPEVIRTHTIKNRKYEKNEDEMQVSNKMGIRNPIATNEHHLHSTQRARP